MNAYAAKCRLSKPNAEVTGDESLLRVSAHGGLIITNDMTVLSGDHNCDSTIVRRRTATVPPPSQN